MCGPFGTIGARVLGVTGAERRFYRRWIVANGWSEAAGLGTTFVVGTAIAPVLEGDPGVASVLVGTALAVTAGIFLEGVVVGVAQGRVVCERLPGVSVRAWVIATAIGAGVAWLIGMVPSTVFALMEASGPETAVQEPGRLAQLSLAVGLGLVTGPILGSAQWLVLKRVAPRAGRWLWANAAAWAVGMPVVFTGMDLVPWDGGALPRAVAIYGTCLVAGLSVGAVHGRALLALTRAPENAPQ